MEAILDLVPRTIRHPLGDQRPLSAILFDELREKVVFRGSPGPLVPGPQLKVPAVVALLRGAIWELFGDLRPLLDLKLS